jgi:hypothetical protein
MMGQARGAPRTCYSCTRSTSQSEGSALHFHHQHLCTPHITLYLLPHTQLTALHSPVPLSATSSSCEPYLLICQLCCIHEPRHGCSFLSATKRRTPPGTLPCTQPSSGLFYYSPHYLFRYPIAFLEDPFEQDDWAPAAQMTATGLCPVSGHLTSGIHDS